MGSVEVVCGGPFRFEARFVAQVDSPWELCQHTCVSGLGMAVDMPSSLG